MKMALLVCNSYFMDRVMTLLAANGIDYYTTWDNAKHAVKDAWNRVSPGRDAGDRNTPGRDSCSRG